MKPKPRLSALIPLAVFASLLLLGCGGDEAPEEPADAAPADTAAPEQPDPSIDADIAENAESDTDCELPDGLVERLGMERQLVLNLALAGGDNFEAVESVGLPAPATFRSVAEALGGLDLSGVEPNATFDEPDDVVSDLNETADHLEAALAADTDTGDPAWAALSEFYTQEFFARHNASVGYYLTEAGCV